MTFWVFLWVAVVLFLVLVLLALWLSDDDGSDERTERAIPVIQKLRIQYQDANGDVTTREIKTRFYDPDRGTVRARCSLRKADRTFRLDRIKEAIDIDTGEVITTTLRSYLRKNKLG